MMDDFFCSGFGSGFGSGIFFTVAFWILLIGLLGVLAAWFISRLSRPAASNNGATITTPDGADAIDILKERYARGEISRSEYEEIRADISS